MSSQLLQKQMQACVDNTMHGGGPPPPDFQKPAAGLSKEPGGGSGGPSRDVAHQNNALLSQQTTMLTTNTNAPPPFSTQNRSQALTDPQKCFIVPPSIQLPVAPSTNSTSNDNNRLVGNQVPTMIQDKATAIAINSASVPDGSESALTQQQQQYKRAAGLHSISIDAVAATNYSKKIGKHQTFGAANQATQNNNSSDNHQVSIEQANHQTLATQKKTNDGTQVNESQGMTTKMQSKIKHEGQNKNIKNENRLGKQKVESHSLGPMNNRVPRYNRSAPSQNNMGPQVSGPANTLGSCSLTYGNQHQYGHARGGGAASNNSLAPMPAKIVNPGAYNQLLNSNPQQHLHYHHSQQNQKDRLANNYRSQNAVLVYQDQNQNTNTDEAAPPRGNYQHTTMVLHQSQHQDGNRENEQKQMSSRLKKPTIFKQNAMANQIQTNSAAIEDSCDSGHQGDLMVQQQSSVKMVPAGLSTVASQRSQQSSRRRTNIKQCQQMVAAYTSNTATNSNNHHELVAQDAAAPDHMPSTNQSQTNLHQSNHRRQSTEPGVVSSQARIEQYSSSGPMVLGANVQSNNQLALYELLQRNSLPPITTMSPMAEHQNNDSGISDSRKRGHGMKGLFPIVPGSTRAANQQHSSSLHADCQRVGGRRVQGGYRKNSNHTQLITKTKANLFDTSANTVQGSKTRRSDGQFGGSSRVNSVKRTSNDKINQARQGYYACQCTEHLLSGNPNESKRAMNFLDCPDHITGPQTIAQLKSARNRQLKPYTINSVANATSSHRREAIMVDPKTKMVKSAHVGGAASGGKHKKTYLQQSQHNNLLEDAHNAERFIQKSFTGNVNSGSLALDKPCVFDEPPIPVAQQMMRKTQLSIVGQQQHFTPQKPKLRKTFHQNDRALAKDSLNQNHQRKHLQAVPVQVIPSEDIKFASNKNTHGRKKKRLFGQTIYSDQSSRDGVAACVVSQGALDPEYTPHTNSEQIGGVAAVTGATTVSQMMRMQQVLNASSEKVNRRVLANTRRSNPDSAQGDAQGTEISQNNSSYGNQEENAADLYIKENQSTLASVEKQQLVRQKMRSEKEMYLEQIRKNEEARLQNLNLQQHTYESPGKINSQMPWATGLETLVSPHSNGTKNLQPQFSMGSMPAKNLTDVKTWATPPEAPQPRYQIGKGIRQNYAVPVNTMEKQGVQEQKFQNLSPLVMRLSNQSSAQDQSLQRPLLNFNLLQCSNEERKAEKDTEQKGGKVQPENKEPSPQELITMTKIDGKDFLTVQQTEDQNQSAPASPLKTPKKKLSRHSTSQHNIVYDLDKAKSTPSLDDAAHHQTPRSKGEFESHQKSSRIASACPQNDRSPKMGDITNIARQQSVNQIMPQSQQTDYYSATEKQLSFRQFKNPNRATCVQKREHSGTKSSYEEAIRSEIASDMHIENSDELGQSGTAIRASGRDFSCIFDADSEGPKQDKSEVQIDKVRRQELQTVKRGQKLGEGSFGEVYQGLYDGAQSQYSGSYGSEQNALPPQMAIKVMRVEDKRLLSKLETELELLRTLKHRHIVQYYGCLINDEKNEASIFMELMPHSLQTQYRNFGPLHERVIKRHTKQILEALCYLHNHELRIIHGDLKAANILSDAGCTKLTDFGDSRKLEALPQDLHASSESGALMNEFKGSILWMAPECFTNSVVGRRSDIWSLGCTLIELASAQHPWHGIRDLYHLIQKLESQELPDIPESLSPNAKDFIQKCLIYEKDKRPTAQELMNHPFVDDGLALKTPAQQKNQEAAEK